MADSRYSKYYSNFILKKKHQQSTKGTIWERDWVTIGSQYQIEPGKRRYFYDGNFIFTDNIMPAHKKWHNFGTTMSVWNYDDVAEAKGLVNNVEVNWETNDLRDFAYYGSCVELVKASVEDIIYWFPGRLEQTDILFSLDNTEETLKKEYTYSNDGVFVKVISEYVYGTLDVIGKSSCFYDTVKNDYRIVLNATEYERLDSEMQETFVYDEMDGVYVKGDNNGEHHISFEEYKNLSGDGQVDFEKVIDVDTNEETFVKTLTVDEAEDYVFRGVYDIFVGNTLSNPYEIDLYKFNIPFDEYVNDLKYFAKTWRKYQVDGNDINDCYIENRWGSVTCPNDNINNRVVHIIINYGENKTLYEEVNIKKLTEEEYYQLPTREKSKCVGYEEGYLFIYREDLLGNCEIKHAKYINRERYEELTENDKLDYLQITENKYIKILWNEEDYDELPDEGETIVIDGYNQNATDVIYAVVDGQFKYIHPKKFYLQRFFDKLDVFESVLLNRKTRPLYHAVFITPFESEKYEYEYNTQDYIWPSIDGYIDISSLNFTDYLTKLVDTATKMDDLWCDNMWRNMTHEAIKNYDWTRKQDYIEGDAEEFIAGGERVEQIIHIYGRAFDDIKRYIDGIKFTTNISYDNINNMPVAEISDKLNFKGWDITSTIPVISDDVTRNALMLSELNLTYAFLNYYVQKQGGATTDTWFNSLNPEMHNSAQMDVGFLRRLTLASRYILASKGTKKAIEMILALFGYGDDDFSISETYHYTYPLEFDMVVSDKLSELTHKIQDSDEDVDYYGIPIEKRTVNYNEYLVPFYSNEKKYIDNLYFQGLGGWCGRKNGDDSMTYTETLSYFYSVAKVNDLLSLNPLNLKNGDIYYVIDVSDYSDYTEDIPEDLSHYFILRDAINANYFASWDYIVMDNESRDFVQEEYDKAMYLTNIVSTNVGNNPHTGYGEYDNGDNFIKRLSDPLEVLLSDGTLSDEDVETINLLRNIGGEESIYPYAVTFDIGKVESDENNSKVKQLSNTHKFNVTFNTNYTTISAETYDAFIGDDTKSLFVVGDYGAIKDGIIYSIPNFYYELLSEESRIDYEMAEGGEYYINTDKMVTRDVYESMEEAEQIHYAPSGDVDEEDNPVYYFRKLTVEEYNSLINIDPASAEDSFVKYGDLNTEGNEECNYGKDKLFPNTYESTVTSISNDRYRRMSTECRSLFIFTKVENFDRFNDKNESKLISNSLSSLEETSLALKNLVDVANSEEDSSNFDMLYCYECIKTDTERLISKEIYWAWYEASDIAKKVLIDYDENFYQLYKYITVDTYNELDTMVEIREMYIPVYANSHFVYLNSKVVKLRNNIINEKHIMYFNSVILPYITQMIPSSTILILENL